LVVTKSAKSITQQPSSINVINKQQATSNKQQAKNNKQQTTNNKQATSNKQQPSFQQSLNLIK
jgi:hypothetical protein